MTPAAWFTQNAIFFTFLAALLCIFLVAGLAFMLAVIVILLRRLP